MYLQFGFFKGFPMSEVSEVRDQGSEVGRKEESENLGVHIKAVLR
tara:strand:+ start:110 stop:244 length:135 start_codon:yes stop_codon:yes gene_type:complete